MRTKHIVDSPPCVLCIDTLGFLQHLLFVPILIVGNAREVAVTCIDDYAGN